MKSLKTSMFELAIIVEKIFEIECLHCVYMVFRSDVEVSSYQEHSKEDESPYHGAGKF